MSAKTRNWTIVSMHYRDSVEISERYPMGWKSRVEKYVVQSGLKSVAEKVVHRQIAGGYLDEPNEVFYYPRNYVDEYHRLIAAGRVIR